MEYKYSKSVNQHEYGRVNRAISPVCTRVHISWIFKEGDVTGSIQVLERGISGTNTGERAWFSFWTMFTFDFLRAKEWEIVISETTSWVTAPCDETNRMDPLKVNFWAYLAGITEREFMNDALI